MSNNIESRKNKKLKYISLLMSSPKYRYKNREFVIEGKRLCEDALRSGININTLFYTRNFFEKHSILLDNLLRNSNESYQVNEKLFNYFSDTKTPQGVACSCFLLDKIDYKYIINSKSHVIGLENIRDPSNLGTIMRTAEAFGLKNIVLSKECCDIYNPKVIRGSMGAIFRVNIFIPDNFEKFITLMKKSGFCTCASVLSTNTQPINELNLKSGKFFMILGNEANGIKPNVIKTCDYRVHIPMDGNAESLNVASAASILMWEMVR